MNNSELPPYGAFFWQILKRETPGNKLFILSKYT